jgi:hypothetical protein
MNTRTGQRDDREQRFRGVEQTEHGMRLRGDGLLRGFELEQQITSSLQALPFPPAIEMPGGADLGPAHLGKVLLERVHQTQERVGGRFFRGDGHGMHSMVGCGGLAHQQHGEGDNGKGGECQSVCEQDSFDSFRGQLVTPMREVGFRPDVGRTEGECSESLHR